MFSTLVNKFLNITILLIIRSFLFEQLNQNLPETSKSLAIRFVCKKSTKVLQIKMINQFIYRIKNDGLGGNRL